MRAAALSVKAARRTAMSRLSQSLSRQPLGSSDLEITRVGFGAWAIGGGGWSFGWGPQDDTASLAAMRHAVDLGINWIDTAAVYGGHSEEIVGRLTAEDIEEIAAAVEHTGAGAGPARLP
jgi:aryl-alcohol dehydrogenase-like predicted oxidoreductase